MKFVSRISDEVTGRILFINIKENTVAAAASVFELKSLITGRISDRIWNVSGVLYEQVEFPIEIHNKFTTADIVDFSVTYLTEYTLESSRRKSQKTVLSEEQQVQTIYGKQ